MLECLTLISVRGGYCSHPKHLTIHLFLTGWNNKARDTLSPKILKELLRNSEELESQADQTALKDFKGFNCRKSMQRQTAETVCRDSMQRQPTEAACRESLQIYQWKIWFQKFSNNFERVQKNSKDFKRIQKIPKDFKIFQ